MDSPSSNPGAAPAGQDQLWQIERLLKSDPAKADQQASAYLAGAPGDPAALLLQGIARRLMGNQPAAIEILTPFCTRWPDDEMAHLQLGLALRESGQDQAAVQAMRRAVAVKPDYSDAWLALADLLTAMQDVEGADAAFAMYLRHSSSDPRLMEAATALRENRAAEAETMLRALLVGHPNDIAALCMLADIHARFGQTGEAEALLRQCLDLAPGYRVARQNYVVVLMRQDKSTTALQEADRLLAAEPMNPAFHSLRAAVLGRLGEYEESIGVYERLLAKYPDKPRLWTSLGHALRAVGQRTRCIEAYQKAMAIAPDFGEAYWNLANLKTLQITDSELESMRAQLPKPDLSEEDRVHFHFAIGKALEDRGDFAGSFQQYADGNRIRRQGVRYNAAELGDHLRRCKSLFTAKFFAERTGQGSPAADPIFVVGMPRSGSTLVEQILASHTQVEGTRELSDLIGMAMSLDRRMQESGPGRYPEILAELDREACLEFGESYLRQTRAQRKRGTPFFIDKMPNNFAHAGLIHLILPNARIVDVRRHPMACGWSLFKHLFARGQNFSYQLDEIGRYYRDYVELMAHFDAVLPGRVHRVFYESLVDNTETEVRRLLAYCGLPFEEACMKFHDNKRAVSTPSSEQVRSPIFREGIEHWRHYEPWLDPLKTALGPLVAAYPQVPAST